MAVVLCTGVDPLLLETRRLILEQAGHTVVVATQPANVIAVCKEWLFDVAVLSQSLMPGTKRSFASLIRLYCPSAKILELHLGYHEKAVEDADSWLEVPADAPEELVARVAELTRVQPGKKMSA